MGVPPTHLLSRLFSTRGSSYKLFTYDIFDEGSLYPLLIQNDLDEVFLVHTGYPDCSPRGVSRTHWLSRLISRRCSSYPLVIAVNLVEVLLVPTGYPS